MTIEVTGKSKSLRTFGVRRTESLNFQQKPLIYPHEITQEIRKGEQISLVQEQLPIRCGRFIYFRRKGLKVLAQKNRFASKLVIDHYKIKMGKNSWKAYLSDKHSNETTIANKKLHTPTKNDP
ncbi:type IV secretory system conjugative DNA transfer family protein [Bartonella sp. CB189]|uniref:type IV secretory system conjugative DNA transfer family protein n=1 Tax=Bartonella sp. CB189 TaxID=3112254 RepID=UPI002F96E25D